MTEQTWISPDGREHVVRMRVEGGVVDLMIDEYYVVCIEASGSLYRVHGVEPETGLMLDEQQRIVEVE